jgi:hypothetical protein
MGRMKTVGDRRKPSSIIIFGNDQVFGITFDRVVSSAAAAADYGVSLEAQI